MASIPPSQQLRPTIRQQHSQSDDNASNITQSSSPPITDTRRTESDDTQQNSTQSTIQHASPPPPQTSQDDLRRCWICFEDEVEGVAPPSEWRSPCPCALTAHEACLLDWIADMEAPNSRRPRTGMQSKIECPQCKAEILVARPRSVVVDSVRAIEGACHRAIIPSVLLLSASSVYRLFFDYGLLSVEAVFGPYDAARFLEPLFTIPQGDSLQALATYFKSSLRLNIGLPLIPPVLILSRTSIGDGVLPILPMLFLATAPAQDPLLDLGDWPPSAGFSFAVLPFARSAYNLYFEKVWGERERRWLREIQPRVHTEADADDNEVVVDEPAPEEEINILEINIDIPLNGDQQAIPDDEAQPQPDLILNPNPDPDPEANAEAVPQQRAAVALGLGPLATKLADTTLGALAFPFLSALSGDILRLLLPRSWTTLSSRGQTGFLQARWARSIVGGCLLVVLKDAVMLYVRWRMARDHSKRRVVQWDKVRRRFVT